MGKTNYPLDFDDKEPASCRSGNFGGGCWRVYRDKDGREILVITNGDREYRIGGPDGDDPSLMESKPKEPGYSTE
jgi:hypothetical protein